MACHAPPTRPASCPCSRPSRPAAFRARHPPQIQPIAPSGAIESRHTKGGERVRQRQRRRPPALARRSPGSSRRSGASWSSARRSPRIARRLSLEAHSPAKRGRRGGSARQQEAGRRARVAAASGTAQSAHIRRRRHTASGWSARPSGRSCWPSVAERRAAASVLRRCSGALHCSSV